LKINIWLNDYHNKYNQSPKSNYNHADVNLINKIVDESSEEDVFILRGEPTIHPFLWQILNKLQNKNFILSTESANTDNLISYKKNIPYLSFRWDGFINDKIRGKRPLTLNMQKILSSLSSKETQLRVEYTISPYNLEYLDIDMIILQKMMNEYSRMKQPYFVIYQQSEIYDYNGYIWTPLSKEKISQLNSKGLFTEKTMKFFDSWINKRDYSCTAPRNELTIDYQGDARLCQSMRFHEIIGNVNLDSLQDIISSSKSIRDKASECPFRKQCWLAYHYKDNVNG
jgi:MoaA/NifB/PqqE/SkfB family radical SAM enzyme